MTRYYVLKSKINEYFGYGSLFYTNADKQGGEHLLLTNCDDENLTEETIIAKALLVEINKEEFEQIKNSTAENKVEVLREIIQLNSSEKLGVVRKGHTVTSSGEELPAILNYSMYLSGPSGDEPSSTTKDDVWGEFDPVTFEKLSEGMVVARSEQTCPHFGDVIPYKSVTVVCQIEQEEDVHYWLEYVHGANAVSMRKPLPDNQVAIRSDYQCW